MFSEYNQRTVCLQYNDNFLNIINIMYSNITQRSLHILFSLENFKYCIEIMQYIFKIEC